MYTCSGNILPFLICVSYFFRCLFLAPDRAKQGTRGLEKIVQDVVILVCLCLIMF
jgi:hypothetical protein